MYSATPPENVTWSIGEAADSGASRSRPAPPAAGACPRIASNSRSAMPAASARAASGASSLPTSRLMPCAAAKRRPASSTRAIRPSGSRQIRRAPTSSAVTSITRPSAQTAIFAVPPPTSTFMIVALSRIERATAPEPCAAITVSRLSPAETATILPAWRANSSPILRALRRRTATPVRISAPVSISSGSTLASWYWRSMKAPSACASISSSAE